MTPSDLTPVYLKLKALSSFAAAGIISFIDPALPYGLLCTAMIFADLISARMLARRIRRRYSSHSSATKLSSHKLGVTIVTLIKVYTLLLLAHGVDSVIICSDSISLLRFAAALVCFWQFWSILENESSANDSAWARIGRRILIDKTERHLGVDLSELKARHNPPLSQPDDPE